MTTVPAPGCWTPSGITGDTTDDTTGTAGTAGTASGRAANSLAPENAVEMVGKCGGNAGKWWEKHEFHFRLK